VSNNQRHTEGQKQKRFHFKPDPQSPPEGWTRQRVGAVFGLAGGLISILFGAALTALAWLAQAETARYLQNFGTVLFVLAIPLLIFGAHCLDSADKRAARSNSAERAPQKRGQTNIEPVFILSMLIGTPILVGSIAQTQAHRMLLSVPRAAMAQTTAVSRRRRGGGSASTERSRS
jgi:hypothetical protein